ncbi:MAG: hypothetical protein E7773_09915 [Sphingomonas sp.]|uniref:DUF6894 family protein n=1 Tax=Sphingomonas sp. TaxID=28214 RepID=UPI0011F44E62|nr:hypothetical protein [Sphingomonas sp.]THD36221.1 MAG: hypothetical protein E7773_09915 [Sphingomonas sp.]
MPLYYFNIDNDDVTEDFEGAELADDIAAHAYAVAAARSLAAETVKLGHFAPGHRIHIVDAAREPVGTVTFGEAVEIRT